MRPDGGRLARGRRRQRPHGFGVAGVPGVMQQPRHRRIAATAQEGERAGVEVAAKQRRQRGLDGLAGQLVPEGEAVLAADEQPARDAGIGPAAASGRRAPSSAAASTRRGKIAAAFERPACRARSGGRRAQAPRRARSAAVGCVPPAREQLGDEERVALAGTVEGAAVHAGLAGQRVDAGRGQRGEVDAGDAVGRDVGERPAQVGMATGLVVAALSPAAASGRRRTRRPRKRTKSRVASSAQCRSSMSTRRRVVRRREGLERLMEHRQPLVVPRDRPLQVPAGGAGEVVQRSERVPAAEVLACAAHARWRARRADRRRAPAPAWSCRSPASPEIAATWPRPRAASARRPRNRSRGRSRSSSSIGGEL